MNDYLLGVIVGGAIALLSSFLTDFLRARREEKKWKLESTQEFFRRLDDLLALFFSVPYKIL